MWLNLEDYITSNKWRLIKTSFWNGRGVGATSGSYLCRAEEMAWINYDPSLYRIQCACRWRDYVKPPDCRFAGLIVGLYLQWIHLRRDQIRKYINQCGTLGRVPRSILVCRPDRSRPLPDVVSGVQKYQLVIGRHKSSNSKQNHSPNIYLTHERFYHRWLCQSLFRSNLIMKGPCYHGHSGPVPRAFTMQVSHRMLIQCIS